MLKWANPALKVPAMDRVSDHPHRRDTPFVYKRLRRRTTAVCQANKENFPPPVKEAPKSSPSTTSNYATTLPSYEEEYSPSTFLPVGQELALRGLFPDVFTGKQRYFSSPQLLQQISELSEQKTTKHVGPRRNLDNELLDIQTPKSIEPQVSTKMSDRSLDKLIDDILESACKTQKRKKPPKGLNLRRRTLLKSQQECIRDMSLSPSYFAGDDPASDLPPTPLPHTPGLQASISKEALLQMPTPVNPPPPVAPSDESTTTFNLETPLQTRSRKRRSPSETKPPKRYKRESNGYLEVGIALPSIYV